MSFKGNTVFAALIGALLMLLLAGCGNLLNTLSAETDTADMQEQANSRTWKGGDFQHPVFGKMYWQCWHNDKGTVKYTNTAPGLYSVHWDKNGQNDANLTVGQGFNPGTPDRKMKYQGSFRPNGNGYLAFYGWTYEWQNGEGSKKVNQVEYYVIDSYGSHHPGSGATKKGSFTSDGASYDVYYRRQINQPSLDGNQDFDQFISVRNPKKPNGDISGTITFSNHVAAWQQFGLNLTSTWDYQIMLTEGYGSSGTSVITIVPENINTPSGYHETLVALKSWYNSKYLCADLNRNSSAPLYADRNAIGAWEKFYIVELGGNKVALRSAATGKYASAENGGAKQAVANRSVIDEWETFDMEFIPPYIVTFKNRVTTMHCDGRYSGWYLRFDGLMQQYKGNGCTFTLERL